ncbi:hypothetical protein [Nocardioides daphniae]|uniref:Uncharacterized protein n=1 Tax=Nocardioides daphniae TaxID=402297 RepID=A0A4P7UDE5_9ACTN|nr:hypothetical protein [Nocardioides daphniae]QCC77348.1 hypothetical protein E2C04_09430 [Nocardioides daphniae]GGD25072.1 hypothetical protein GCM10007231_25430 [Nocardioides daphniae]
MSIVDLASDHHEWLEASIAGADLPARMYPLHVDLQRGTRTVLLTFPDGWNRPATGTQPAGEELVPLSGGLTMSGQRVGVGEVLVVTPRVLRSATASEPGTRAVVFYTGSGGGWVDGDSLEAGTVSTRTLGEGVVREPVDGLAGRLELVPEVPEDGFDQDVEVVWLQSQQYAVVPRRGLPPQVEGPALVRFLD